MSQILFAKFSEIQTIAFICATSVASSLLGWCCSLTDDSVDTTPDAGKPRTEGSFLQSAADFESCIKTLHVQHQAAQRKNDELYSEHDENQERLKVWNEKRDRETEARLRREEELEKTRATRAELEAAIADLEAQMRAANEDAPTDDAAAPEEAETQQFDCQVCYEATTNRVPCCKVFACESCLLQLVEDDEYCCPACFKMVPVDDGPRAVCG